MIDVNHTHVLSAGMEDEFGFELTEDAKEKYDAWMALYLSVLAR